MHRIHRSCCRFPADREQARSHGLRPESQLSCGAPLRMPFWTLSGPAHRMHRSCCRFPADREQARSHGLRPESQPSCGALRRMPFWTLSGPPHAPVLLPVLGRLRASSLPRPAAKISTIVRRSASYAVLDAQRPGPPHSPVLLPVPGRSRASSLPRPAARISTIVRRSASHAVLDALRPIISTFESPHIAR